MNISLNFFSRCIHCGEEINKLPDMKWRHVTRNGMAVVPAYKVCRNGKKKFYAQPNGTPKEEVRKKKTRYEVISEK